VANRQYRCLVIIGVTGYYCTELITASSSAQIA
jgi:hypothetical protein